MAEGRETYVQVGTDESGAPSSQPARKAIGGYQSSENGKQKWSLFSIFFFVYSTVSLDSAKFIYFFFQFGNPISTLNNAFIVVYHAYIHGFV